ncbi:unnamed protein product, partial [marine sediment metagenome]
MFKTKNLQELTVLREALTLHFKDLDKDTAAYWACEKMI